MSKFQAALTTIEAFFNASPKEDSAVAARHELPAPPKRLILGLMFALVIYVIVRGVAAAAVRTFLFDELLALAVASQSSTRAMWNALSEGVDSQAPLFYLIERAVLNVLKNKQIALRLPAILALPCTLTCVFVYVRRKSSEFIAFLCAVLILLTSLFHIYAVDGRAYGMVIACIAFALVCYQRVPSPIWTIMLGVSLILAELLHYYAIFSMLPFWVAEFVCILRARRFRWQVSAALALGPVPLLLFWPWISHLRALLGPHIWTHYGLSSIPLTYGGFFLTGGAFGFAVVSVCVVGIVGARLLTAEGKSGERVERDPVEAALLLALLALPFPTALAVNLMHGAMLDRYLLASALGVALTMACVMSWARERVVLLFAVFVFSSVAVHEFTFWRSVHSLRLDNLAPPVEALIQKAGHPDLPVVVSDGVTYLQLAYYAPPEWKKRFVFLEDSEKAVKYSGTDSIDKNLVILRPYMPIQVDALLEFVAAHPAFLLYVEDPGAGFDWLPGYFSEVASSVQVVVVEANRKVYLVTMKAEASR